VPTLLDTAAHVYLTDDLIPPGAHLGGFAAPYVTVTREGPSWVVRLAADYDYHSDTRTPLAVTDDEPTYVYVREVIRSRCWYTAADRPPEHVYTVATPAEPVAQRFRKRLKLTAADLLADPDFCRCAREAAERNRTYTTELLEWEAKAVVAEAVAVFRAEVDAERAVAAANQAAVEAERAAKLERERPTREAVEEAYDRCGFRVARQGHSTAVVIGEQVGAAADKVRGDRYSSRCTFAKMTSAHTLRVRPDYLARVAAVGPTVHAGCLVLDAEPVGADAYNYVLYRLTLAVQGPGTGLKTTEVETFARGGLWVGRTKRDRVTLLPAFALADYLQEQDADAEIVDAVRAVTN
jgi:hypothetical protein